MFKKKMEIIIKGMKCEHCVKKVTDSLMRVEGIKKVKVDLKTGKTILFYQDDINVNEVKEVINELGYEILM